MVWRTLICQALPPRPAAPPARAGAASPSPQRRLSPSPPQRPSTRTPWRQRRRDVACAQEGLANVARRVMHAHLEPLSLEPNGLLSRDEPGPLLATSSTRTVNPPFIIWTAQIVQTSETPPTSPRRHPRPPFPMLGVDSTRSTPGTPSWYYRVLPTSSVASQPS
jgi:hypothetical protein